MNKTLMAAVLAVAVSLFASVSVAFANPSVHAYTKDGFVIDGVQIMVLPSSLMAARTSSRA